MSKTYSIFLSALFCVFIGGMALLSLALPDRSFSPMENRYLQKPPKLSWESLSSGKFMEDAEDYLSDQIAGRDLWVAAKAWSERLSGKQENEGVYFGAENTLLTRVEEPSLDKLERDVGYVDALVENLSVPVYFGLIPSAAEIWRDRLPQGAPTADEKAAIDRLYFSSGAETVDLYSALYARREEALYYRTDHHWTSLGAFYGANALLESMGLEPLELGDYEKTTVTSQFYGTSFSISGVRWLPPDSIDVYVPEEGVQVTSYADGTPREGSLYMEGCLEEKDKYAYFLGGNQPLCVIRTERTGAPRVLLVRDSYSDALAPFLTERFSEIHLFDLRYNMSSVRQYVEDNGIDAVAVLYSFPDFLQDQSLALLTR